MGTYNTLDAEMACPRCGETSRMEIDLYFGYRRLLRYHLGSKYTWDIGKSVKNGGRPDNGTMLGEGYAECPVCTRDFFVNVTVVEDVLTSVAPDTSRPGYKD